MSKIAVAYWSGTGHTKQMAETVAEAAGAELFSASDFEPQRAGEYDAIAFGCPSMGTEQLEETEFEPMYEAVKGELDGKRVALFGSYGWGDGEWMREWEADVRQTGAILAHESVVCQDEPDDAALSACRELGEALAKA